MPADPRWARGQALERALQTFTAEARLLEKISQASKDVESVLASGIADRDALAPVPYTVFEWLAGSSLERHLGERGGAGSIGEALVILEPAARALAVAHSLGAAHRDVRPGNLWLAELGGRTTVKVAAFGLATTIGPGETAFAPEYGAPEHFKRSYGAIGPATDVYGLALVLIEMVTGRRALEGADAGELYLATSNLARRPTLRARGVHVSDAVESVLQRALAVDPRRRWQSARELWDGLIAAVPELMPAPPSVRPRASERPAGLASFTHPGVMDSPPASVPPGVARRADDARLSDAIPIAATTGASAGVTRPSSSSAEVAERGGAWAWLGVASLAVLAVGVVVAKVGGSARGQLPSSAAPDAAAASTSRVAAGPGADPGAGGEESAVTVQPFLLDMVKIPAGTFVMGSDHEGKGDGPAHRVTLTHAFYIDRTEVPAEAYAACIEGGACSPPRVHTGDLAAGTYGCNTHQDRPRHPANCVDHLQAETYCAFVHKRLPTEAEWEYAARGPDGRDFPWGSAPPTTCSTAILSGMTGPCGERRGTWEIGTAAEGKSAFGALDMAGNVWEWVADGYEAYPSQDAGASAFDPRSPLPPGGRGILRGGSWDYAVTSAKVTYRLPFQVATGNASTGFRCARSAE